MLISLVVKPILLFDYDSILLEGKKKDTRYLSEGNKIKQFIDTKTLYNDILYKINIGQLKSSID